MDDSLCDGWTIATFFLLGMTYGIMIDLYTDMIRFRRQWKDRA